MGRWDNKQTLREISLQKKTELYKGVKFGILTFLEATRYNDHGDFFCKVICECGNFKEVRFYQLKNETTASCGCRIGKTCTHGLTDTALYKVWLNIKQRCYDTKSGNFKYYGAKGVLVCDEWKNNFLSFRDWCLNNNWRKGLQIDRFPNKKGNYEPNNCRVTTAKINSNNKCDNKIIEVYGLFMTMSECADKHNVKYQLLSNRLRSGWDIKAAIDTPPLPLKMSKKIQNKIKSGEISFNVKFTPNA